MIPMTPIITFLSPILTQTSIPLPLMNIFSSDYFNSYSASPKIACRWSKNPCISSNVLVECIDARHKILWFTAFPFIKCTTSPNSNISKGNWLFLLFEKVFNNPGIKEVLGHWQSIDFGFETKQSNSLFFCKNVDCSSFCVNPKVIISVNPRPTHSNLSWSEN